MSRCPVPTAVLEDLADGLLAEEAARRTRRHLAGCARCAEAWRRLGAGREHVATLAADDPDPGGLEDAARAFQEWRRRAAGGETGDGAASRRPAPTTDRLWAELDGLSAEHRELLLGNGDRFVDAGLCARLAEAARDLVFHDPERAAQHAREAVVLAGRLGEPPEDRPAPGATLAGQRAAAALGNALRVLGDLEAAGPWLERAAVEARELGDGGLRSEAARLLGHLRFDQRRLDEAVALFAEARDRARAAGDGEAEARARLGLASARAEAGQVAAAVRDGEENLERLRRDGPPRLLLAALHDLVDSYRRAGRLADADRLLPELRRRHREHPAAMSRNRLRWLEGQLAGDRGDLATAERLLRRARDRFLAEGLAYDAALVALDLAALLVDGGRTREVARLAAETLAVFRRQGIARESLAALLVVERAARRERLGRGLVAACARRLRRSPTARV